MDKAAMHQENIPADITYVYQFMFQDGSRQEFTLALDHRTLAIRDQPPATPPAWTRLASHGCPHCPLDARHYAHCPVAVHLVRPIKFFGNFVSYEDVDVVIAINERNYTKHTAVQSAVSSLIGIIMVTSGCPIMEKLKPMVRFHLPFATIEETTYRVISMYLLAQYFMFRQGKTPDWELKNLVRIYDDINVVNGYFGKRIKEATQEDAGINALVILDAFAQAVKFSIKENMLDDIEELFNAYLR
jgi:hypothetical protein